MIKLITIISDIKFVTTTGEELPTPENSRPIEADDDRGRGSVVYFNMATMFQSSETGFSTILKAKAAGHSGNAEFGIQQAFELLPTRIPVEPTY